jgi:hypothetical protein
MRLRPSTPLGDGTAGPQKAAKARAGDRQADAAATAAAVGVATKDDAVGKERNNRRRT